MYFKKILIAVDGSEESFRAADAAIAIADKYDSEITIFCVINPSLKDYYYLQISKTDQDLIEKEKEDARKWFKIISEKTNKKTVLKTHVVESYRPVHSEIVEYADSNQIDLIVAGSRGRTGFKKLLLGSVASGIVTYATCAVLIVK